MNRLAVFVFGIASGLVIATLLALAYDISGRARSDGYRQCLGEQDPPSHRRIHLR